MNFFVAQRLCLSRAIEDGFEDGTLLNFVSPAEQEGITVRLNMS